MEEPHGQGKADLNTHACGRGEGGRGGRGRRGGREAERHRAMEETRL